jgi:predicted amidohydrolase YtcJ
MNANQLADRYLCRFLMVLTLPFSQVLFPGLSHADSSQSADSIFLNGNIYRGSVEDRKVPLAAAPVARAEALAVKDGRFVAVGTNSEIRKWATSKTRTIDLGGRFVMPGFNDAHLHLAQAGMQRLQVDLVGSVSLGELKQRVADYCRRAAPRAWIQGGGWDQTLWARDILPTRSDLDEVTTGHPAFLLRIDAHIGLANSEALRLGGIGPETPDPPGGHIDRDGKGEPTGILREGAKQLVTAKIPKPTPLELRRAIEAELEDAARWGITSAQDYSEWSAFLVYEDLLRENKLTLRISEWLPLNASLKDLEDWRAHHQKGDPYLKTTMLKGFMDGSLGSRTAALFAPYSDDPGNSGLPQYEESHLRALSLERAAAGFQLGFHAIGDRGLQMALDAFAAVKGSRQYQEDLRFRVEHAQVVAPGQFSTLRQLGVVASVQPAFLLYDMKWGVARLGMERARHSYPWGELAANGIPLAFGTDAPVEVLNPFLGLYAAVTRQNEAGTAEYFPEQKVPIELAISAYTFGSAWAELSENEKGRIEPGMLADFVVLDRDISTAPAQGLLKARVLRTVVGGQTVYLAAVDMASPNVPRSR